HDALQPDWSPADVPAAAAPGPVGPTPAPAPAPAPVGPASNDLGVKVATKRLRDALSAGLRLRFTAPGAGRLEVTALRGKRVVARGTRRMTAAGSGVAVAKVTGAGRRVLRGKRSVKLTVRYRFRPAAGGGGAVTSGAVAVTLRR